MLRNHARDRSLSINKDWHQVLRPPDLIEWFGGTCRPAVNPAVSSRPIYSVYSDRSVVEVDTRDSAHPISHTP